MLAKQPTINIAVNLQTQGGADMGRTDETNMLGELITTVRHAWQHRPGQEAVAAVQDVVDNLRIETHKGLKPLLAAKRRTEDGWHLVWHMPPGITDHDFLEHKHQFEVHANGLVELYATGNKLHMHITLGTLPELAPYVFNPADYPKLALPLPIGAIGGSHLLVEDLSLIPYVLVAGMPGYGKTTFMQGATRGLLANGRTLIVIVDLKRVDFAHLHGHPMVAVVDTPDTVTRALIALDRELDRRLAVLRAAKVVHARQYKGPDMPWVVLVVDELAELNQMEVAQEKLNRLARLGRASGICIVGATQRPTHGLWPGWTDTRALFPGRLAFAMADGRESLVHLNTEAAALLPRNPKGRAVWQWESQRIVQVMWVDPTEATVPKVVPTYPTGAGEWLEQRFTRRLLP
jgi:S-DNA-T family DNA segregation ATPase FtsK/SpoIIIE